MPIIQPFVSIVSLMIGIEQTLFDDPVEIQSEFFIPGIAIRDLKSDNQLDIQKGLNLTGDTCPLPGNRDGSVQLPVRSSMSNTQLFFGTSSFACEDINGDGKVDVAYSPDSSQRWVYLFMQR